MAIIAVLVWSPLILYMYSMLNQVINPITGAKSAPGGGGFAKRQMAMNRAIVIFISLVLASCSSNKKEQNETLSALSTVSPVLASVPLVFFAEAHNIINDTEGKNKEIARLLAEKFDPVYNERINIIEARTPEADAVSLIDQGVFVFLPSVPGVKIYPGLLPKQAEDIDGYSNSEAINTNELPTYLSALMSQDPAHKELGRHYFGEPYRQFISTGWAYKKVFNSFMYSALNTKQSSSKPIQPTAQASTD
ncbi:hypothetical protein [Halopseudomonas pelagia]|uniref:hypothetical protein n=1 Tax=Halopseudomonas pelagia TaxID=553151 RepID=UPI0012698772|nr:hypothetical protein [Halopseudomonas pelagia]